MSSGRRWSAAEFRDHFLGHPLMWHLAHRLLWATFDERDAVVALFRVAEDRSLADLDDKTWELGDTATVGVAHPWHFAADRGAWSEVFADYAIIQPFPQLGRELISASEVDVAALTGAEVDGRKLFVLAARGWRFGDGHTSVLRDWPQTVEIAYSPGYHWQDPDLTRHLTAVHGLDGLDPIALSEVLRDLRYLVVR